MSKKSRIGWVIAVISVVAIVAVVLVVANLRSQTSTSPTYQTVAVQTGTLTSTVEGTGSVASALSTSLTWKASGQVAQVNAQIGEQVKSDAVLASLVPDAQTQTNLETNLVTAQENLAELTSPSALASAQAAVASAETALYTAQVNKANLNYHDQGAIANANAALLLAKDKLNTARDAYNNNFAPDTDPGKATLLQNMYAAQVRYDSALYTYNSLSGHASQATVDTTNAALALAEANLADAKTYLAALNGGEVPEGATGTLLLKLKQAKLAVQSAQESLQSNLDSLQLTAPFDGTITQVDAVPNSLVSPGTSAFRLDDLTNLVVAVQVIEIDINSIKIGQPASITFDAIPNKTYTGIVTEADLAGTVGQNSVNYTVTVKVTTADAQVKPGMSANVSIITNQVTNALLVPSTAILTDSNGKPYVTLVQNGVLSQINVTVGATSDTMSQITSDNLKDGDTIVLSFTSTTTSSSGFGLFGGGAGRVSGGGGGGATVVTP